VIAGGQGDGTKVPRAPLPQHRLHVYKPRFYWGFERFYRLQMVYTVVYRSLTSASLLSATEIQALAGAWQSGAISRDTLLHNLRVGEILPSARTNEQEVELIRKDAPPVAVASQLSAPKATMALKAEFGPDRVRSSIIS